MNMNGHIGLSTDFNDSPKQSDNSLDVALQGHDHVVPGYGTYESHPNTILKSAGVVKAEVVVGAATSLIDRVGSIALDRINQGLKGMDPVERTRFVSLFQQEIDQKHLAYKIQVQQNGDVQIQRDPEKIGVVKAEVSSIAAANLLGEHGDDALPRVNAGIAGIDCAEKSKFVSLFQTQLEVNQLPYKLQLSTDGSIMVEKK